MNIKLAIIGGGVIGAGWIARFVEAGYSVNVYDPDILAEKKIADILHNADVAYTRLTGIKNRKKGQVNFFSNLSEAVHGANLVIESVPERLDIKQSVYAEIEKHVSKDTLITSSTSGIKPTDLQMNMQNPERFLVAHPFNPVYLLPALEVVGGKNTHQKTLEKAQQYFLAVGMYVVLIEKEIEAFIADRLMEALWREALWLVHDDIATTQEIDNIICMGFGLRWAQMGVFETFRVAGGQAGMRHFMQQFGPCLKWPWTKLMDVPPFNDELVDKISQQSDEQSGNFDIQTLEAIRDNNLIAIMSSLATNNWGAGSLTQAYKHKIQTQCYKHDYNHDGVLCLTSYTHIPPVHILDTDDIDCDCMTHCFMKATDYCVNVFLSIVLVNDASSYNVIVTNSHLDIYQPRERQQELRVETHIVRVDAQHIVLKHCLLTHQDISLADMEVTICGWDDVKKEKSEIKKELVDYLSLKIKQE